MQKIKYKKNSITNLRICDQLKGVRTNPGKVKALVEIPPHTYFLACSSEASSPGLCCVKDNEMDLSPGYFLALLF